MNQHRTLASTEWMWEITQRTLAFGGLVLLSPFLLLLAITVALESGGPVLFRQQRVGRYGVPFTLLKLRSMRVSSLGPGITRSADERITRVGRFLRKYKLDELPQLWNVVNGEMALVGPRPELARFVELSDPLWQRVLSVRPGLTDPVSLLHRDEEEMLKGVADVEDHYCRVLLPAKLELAAAYLASRGPARDLRVVVLTIWHAVVARRAPDRETLAELFR